MMPRIKIEDLPDSKTFTGDEMRNIYGGPNRREHDHIGAFLLDVDYESVYTDLSSPDGSILK